MVYAEIQATLVRTRSPAFDAFGNAFVIGSLSELRLYSDEVVIGFGCYHNQICVPSRRVPLS